MLTSDASPAPAVAADARPSRTPAGHAIRALAILLILAGALTLIDGVVTLVWQEPISALYAKLRQDHLSGALKQVEHAQPTPVERTALASLADERQRVGYLAGELQHHARNGSPVGRIVIPRIGASYVMVDGTDTNDLKSGPGIIKGTSFPGGIRGTTAIAGHRTTYLAPFRHIDALRPGSHILLDMPYAHFTYTVIGHRVVQPTNVRLAVRNVGYSRLVLSACTPVFSAEKRLLVFAKLTRTVPVGPATQVNGGGTTRPLEGDETEPEPAPQKAPLPAVLKPIDSQGNAPLS